MTIAASRAMDDPAGWICAGVIARAHGIRGEVFIQTYTENPGTVAALADFQLGPAGRAVRLVEAKPHKGGLRARLEGVEDRDAAEALRGARLYVARERLPETGAEEFYHADLIGLRVHAGAARGAVIGVANFGAGDLLEVAWDDGGSALVPFTRDAVPVVDLAAGCLEVTP